MLFGAAYYPEHREEEKWDYDLDLMKKAHVNCLRVGEFAWKRLEPEKGRFDFVWLDDFMDRADKRNIRLLLCPPARTLPNWLIREEPELAIMDGEGDRLAYGSRYSFCINHPLLQERAILLAREMARRYGGRDTVAGWHLDNEHGDEPDCHCPVCRRQFRDWCRERYGTIGELNRRWGLVFWGTELDSFEEVFTPFKSKIFHNPSLLQAWREFRSDSTINLIRLQGEAVGAHRSPDQFITTNHQPVWNNRTDYYKAAEHLDLAGSNYYPPYGDGLLSSFAMAAVRSYNRRNPSFHVHELRNGPHMIPGSDNNQPRPGEAAKLAWYVAANGGGGIFFFRWKSCPFGCEQSHGTLTDYDGRPRRIYHELKKTGEEIARLSPLLEKSRFEAEAAVLYDYPTRWTMETGVAWNGPVKLYMDRVQRIYNGFCETGINVDLTGRDSDWSGYKVLAVPFLSVSDDALAEKFIRFVEEGGTLLWHPLCGVKNKEAVIHPDRLPPALSRKLGDYPMDFFTLGEGETVEFSWKNRTYQGEYFGDYLEGMQFREARVRSWHWGKGDFDYVTTLAEGAFYRDYLEDRIQALGLCRSLAKAPPEGTGVHIQSAEDGCKLLFLLNHRYEPVEIELTGRWTELLTGESWNDAAVPLEACGVKILQERPV